MRTIAGCSSLCRTTNLLSGTARRALFSGPFAVFQSSGLHGATGPSFFRPVTDSRSALDVPPSLGSTSSPLYTAVNASCGASSSAKEKLVASLEKELEKEKEIRVSKNPISRYVQSFLSSSDWTLKHSIGSAEATMSRAFGNETITALFTIHQTCPQLQEMWASALVHIEKPGCGALSFDIRFKEDIRLKDWDLAIANVATYTIAEAAKAETASSDWEKRGLYAGPPFYDLDDDLQGMFAEYIKERGIDKAFVTFFHIYVKHAEQNEYLCWLRNVMDYVKA